jgi:hypothetical protein
MHAHQPHQTDLNHSVVKTKLLEEMQRIAGRLNVRSLPSTFVCCFMERSRRGLLAPATQFASFEVPRAVYVDAHKFTAGKSLRTRLHTRERVE